MPRLRAFAFLFPVQALRHQLKLGRLHLRRMPNEQDCSSVVEGWNGRDKVRTRTIMTMVKRVLVAETDLKNPLPKADDEEGSGTLATPVQLRKTIWIDVTRSLSLGLQNAERSLSTGSLYRLTELWLSLNVCSCNRISAFCKATVPCHSQHKFQTDFRA